VRQIGEHVNAIARVRSRLHRPLAFPWWWLIWVAAGACIFLCGVALGLVSAPGAPGGGWFGGLSSPAFGGRERVTILLVGADSSGGRGLADTIMLAVVSPPTGEISAVSIPRDSRVEVPGVGPRRINAAHNYGGMPLTMQTVEMLLGLPVDYYVEVDVTGLVKLVDAIGGVDLEVEKRMLYHDRSQKLDIDLQPGFQHLNGTQAMGYVRFRHDAVGDLGRMERQRKFLRVVMEKLLSPGNLARLPSLAQTFVETVKTNLSVKDVLSLKRIVEQNGADSVRAVTLSGVPKMIHGQSMIELDAAEVQQTVDRVLLGHGLTVAVLNGAGIQGLAARTADKLEEYGCEITSVGTSQELTDVTYVVDHRGGARRAERVASWLGRGVISAAPDGDNPADVTVVLGRDMVGGTR
jgi:LCP family protein required for cell wall assembly